jgi:hypothetical protein
MGHDGDRGDFEATVRRAFARLVGDELPRAAAARGWPVRTADEFERLLLDHVQDGAPGDGGCLFDLVLAVELGERLLTGKACCVRMSQRLRCGEDALETLRIALAAPRVH